MATRRFLQVVGEFIESIGHFPIDYTGNPDLHPIVLVLVLLVGIRFPRFLVGAVDILSIFGGFVSRPEGGHRERPTAGRPSTSFDLQATGAGGFSEFANQWRGGEFRPNPD